MAMLFLLASLTLVLMGMTTTTGSQCKVHTDGCSVPLHMNWFYKTLFTPSCDRHDYCYRCGAKYGFTQDDCDTAFFNNMLSACASSEARRRDLVSLGRLRGKRFVCEHAAHGFYYEAVHVFGGLFFHDLGEVPSYCSEEGIRECLPKLFSDSANVNEMPLL